MAFNNSPIGGGGSHQEPFTNILKCTTIRQKIILPEFQQTPFIKTVSLKYREQFPAIIYMSRMVGIKKKPKIQIKVFQA